MRVLFLAALPLFLLGCTGGTSTIPSDTTGSQTGEPLLTIGQEARHGTVTLKIEKVQCGKLEMIDSRTKEKKATDKPLIAFNVRARNTSDDLLILLNFWGAGFTSKPFATLNDGKGNEYREFVAGSDNTLAGADKGNRLKPGESSVDVLAFEEPLPAAQDLVLTISVPKHGEYAAGKVRFRIPAKEWKR